MASENACALQNQEKYYFSKQNITSKCSTHIRLKKKNPMSQSCREHLFFCVPLIHQNSRFEFFFSLNFFPVFYELACQNIHVQERI